MMVNKKSYKIYNNTGKVLKEFDSIEDLESSLAVLVGDQNQKNTATDESEPEKIKKSVPKARVILRKQGQPR